MRSSSLRWSPAACGLVPGSFDLRSPGSAVEIRTFNLPDAPTVSAQAKPTSKDKRNAQKECRAERGSEPATQEAFALRFKNFGKCVSTRTKEEAAQRAAARKRAKKQCKTERGKTAETRAAFRQKYGTNKNGRNAFGKCKAKKAKKNKAKADRADRAKREKRQNAAQRCRQERGTTPESRAAFEQKYGTNANKSNAFGKCVSGSAGNKPPKPPKPDDEYRPSAA